ncbi:transporter substrate-binding domain-containing protein [Streptomyces sp. URMC 123]|uniref:transporter substrate-binding domain-containing protein n=1 Tax=Streptomyces sp. URMC 123 TaxID=3423403 RepID=UPI003F1E25BC
MTPPSSRARRSTAVRRHRTVLPRRRTVRARRSTVARRHRTVVALAGALAALAVGCGSSGSGGATVDGVRLVKEGRLTTCTHLPYPPFQFERDGKVVGFDVALIDLVAAELGVEQVVVDKAFETIRTGADLNAGLCDVAAAGMTITDERRENLDFSQPYFEATQALLARKGVRAGSLAEVKAGAARLGSQSATTGEELARRAGIDPTSYESSDAELNGLRTGQVDVIIQDYPVVRNWLKDPALAERFTLSADLRTGESYGFAVRKGGNPKLLEKIDAVIRTARADGTYRKLYEEWIGPMPKGADGR